MKDDQVVRLREAISKGHFEFKIDGKGAPKTQQILAERGRDIIVQYFAERKSKSKLEQDFGLTDFKPNALVICLSAESGYVCEKCGGRIVVRDPAQMFNATKLCCVDCRHILQGPRYSSCKCHDCSRNREETSRLDRERRDHEEVQRLSQRRKYCEEKIKGAKLLLTVEMEDTRTPPDSCTILSGNWKESLYVLKGRAILLYIRGRCPQFSTEMYGQLEGQVFNGFEEDYVIEHFEEDEAIHWLRGSLKKSAEIDYYEIRLEEALQTKRRAGGMSFYDDIAP